MGNSPYKPGEEYGEGTGAHGEGQMQKEGEKSHGNLDDVVNFEYFQQLQEDIKNVLDAAKSWNKVKQQIIATLEPNQTIEEVVTKKLVKVKGPDKVEEIWRKGGLRREVFPILEDLHDATQKDGAEKLIKPFLQKELEKGWYISLRDVKQKYQSKEITAENCKEIYNLFKKKFLLLPDVPMHNNIVYSVAAATTNNLIVSGSDDCTARFWRITDNDSLRCVAAININTGINRVSLNDDGTTLAVATNEGSIQLLDVESLTIKRNLQSKRRTAEAWAVKFGPQHSLATGGVDCAVRLWDIRSGLCHGSLKAHKQWVNGVAFPPSGRILASCSGDKTIKLWDVGEMECVGSLSGHENFVRGIGFARKHELVTCSDDRTVRVWNLFEGTQTRRMGGHAAAVYDLSVNSKQRLVCTASQDSTLRLWNIDTGVCLSTLVGHKADVNSVQFVAGPNYVVSGSDDFSVRIWKCNAPNDGS